jgi:hypothetical protein
MRDTRPLRIAGATALVSTGLLVLAVWRGWLGPDVGRGATFCEAARDGLVKQPANTFSNLGFVVAGLLIAAHAGRPTRTRGVLATHRDMATAMACIVVLLGPATAANHATPSEWGGRFDMLSMYLVASLAAGYAVMRWWRGGPQLFAAGFLGGLAFCKLVEEVGSLPVVMSWGNAAFGSLLVFATVVELRIMRRGETRSQRAFAFASVGTLLAAFAIWNATNAGMCQPYSPLQGHAVWHVLDAVAAYLLYRYYASEVTVGAGATAGLAAATMRA